VCRGAFPCQANTGTFFKPPIYISRLVGLFSLLPVYGICSWTDTVLEYQCGHAELFAFRSGQITKVKYPSYSYPIALQEWNFCRLALDIGILACLTQTEGGVVALCGVEWEVALALEIRLPETYSSACATGPGKPRTHPHTYTSPSFLLHSTHPPRRCSHTPFPPSPPPQRKINK